MDDDFPPQEPMEYTEGDNIMYVAFVKAFAPVLLHLAQGPPLDEHDQIKRIIKKFQGLREDEVPDPIKTTTLRTWVDSESIQTKMGDLSPNEIKQIMEDAKLKILDEDKFHERDYKLPSGKRRHNRTCAITMENIKPGEYYVDFLDNGNPYKVHAIIQYYKLMKETNIDNREEWKTPLRNKITKEQEKQLEDLVKWYDNAEKCTRSKRPRQSTRSKSPRSSDSKRTRGGKKTRTRKIRQPYRHK